ncbi:MAG: hypothetical protein M1419_09700, partial [Bacteroidetes bacterium]|nr:hypothetical protein [Bacteroidota bacterium]
MPTKKAAEKPKELEIEVFKTGEITDSEGDTKNWSLEDLQTIATTYNDKIKEDPGAQAPIVKGHPETDDPAYGWVEKLKVAGETLMAKIKLVPTFAQEVKDEMFKKVSIALYPDLMLRHIGFLGAAQPAVKGLEPVKFNDHEKTFKIFEFQDPPLEPTDTVEALKTAQDERAKKYGIGVKDKIGYIAKPDAYKDLDDESFCDPVNYLYPVHDKPNWYASFKTFSPWDNGYSEVEKQVIYAKFYASALELGIKFEPDRIYFTEPSKPAAQTKKHVDVPAEQLSKKQLIDVVNKNTIQKNNNFQTNQKGKTMTFKEWFDAYVQAITQKLTEASNEEIATQFQSFSDEYVTANPMPADAPAPASEGGTENTEPTEKEKEYAERLETLERENRQMKFKEYFKSQNERLVPAQEPVVNLAFEFVRENKTSREFSEGGKNVKITGEE